MRRAQRLLYLAARDRLTGLYNRGYFDRALRSAVQRVGRDDQPLSLAVLDVDHFKEVNDKLGHQNGDQMLVALANHMRTHVRGEDIHCRMGGEEFVIVMPETDMAVAAVVA